METLQKRFYRVWSKPKNIAKILATENIKAMKKSKGKENSKSKSSAISGGDEILSFVDAVFKKVDALITKLLVKLVVAVHAAIGPYVLLICGTIILIALLFKDEIKAVIKAILPVITGIANALSAISMAISGVVVQLLTSVSNIIMNIGNGISELLKTIFDTVTNIFKPLLFTFRGISNIIERIFNIVQRVLDNPIGAITSSVGEAVGSIKNGIYNFIGGENNILLRLPNMIRDSVSSLKEKVFQLVDYFTSEEFLNSAKELFSNIGQYLGKLWDDFSKTPIMQKVSTLMDSILTVANKFYEKIIAILDNFNLDVISNGINKVVGLVNRVLNFIANAPMKMISSGLSVAKEGITKVFDTGKNLVSSMIGNRENTGGPDQFTLLVNAITQVHRDMVDLLKDISLSLNMIKENKLQVGSFTSSRSDMDKANDLNNIQVTVNQGTNLSPVLLKMGELNDSLRKIVVNTSYTDSGQKKQVWSI